MSVNNIDHFSKFHNKILKIKEKLKNSNWVNICYFAYLGLQNHIITRIPSFTIRHAVLRNLYRMKIGSNTNIEMGVRVFAPERIQIGEHSVIHFDCILDGRCFLEIANCVDIGHQVNIFTLEHDIDDPNNKIKGGKVTICDYVIIGGRSTILPGLIIGEGAVVATGSVVTKDVPPYVMVGGIPARYIRERSRNLTYKLSYRRYFH